MLKDKIIEIIGYYSSSEKVKFTDNLLFDLGYDSIRFIQLILNLEEEFKIEFLDEYLLMEKLSTVENIYNAVSNMIQGDKNE